MLAEPTGEYNLSELFGGDIGLGDVRAHADALPFMADRRLVIVHGLLGRLAGASKPAARRGKSARTRATATPVRDNDALEALLDYLPLIPPSTALVLVEDALDPAIVAGRLPPERAHIHAYDRPRPGDLGRWIERRAKHHGGKLEAAAVRQLAQLAPDDLGLLDGEICKLVTYADGRAVTPDDVELLSVTPEVTIFGLLDA
ncbi:MAG: hypothetical protein H0W09_05230, partial [Solirubrobacterales bacterium]|nr:hypothetical protein [Solirubrobacterales bacterium]